MSLSENIQAKQQELVEARDVLVDLTSKMDDNDETTKDAVDEQTAVVEKMNKDLDRLKKSEVAIEKSISRAVEKGGPAINLSPATKVKDSDKADLLIKSALCTFEAYCKRVPVDQIVVERYGDDEVVKAVTGMTTKAAQNPAMTNVPAWAGNLVRDSYLGFMDLLRGESVIPQIPMTRYEFNGLSPIKIPNRTSATPNLAGAFRGEGDPIRVGALSIGSQTLTPKLLGIIGTYTMEMFDTNTTPGIENLIRDAMIQDTATSLDTAFLGTTAAGGDAPAGIQTYATGGNTVASAGNSAAQITADVRGRLQAMTGANLGRRPVWIMNPARWYGVQLAVNAAGMPAFPEAAAGTLMSIPVITSTNVPAGVVYLVDAAELYFSGSAPRFLGTEVATIHEEDTQANVKPIVSAGTGTAGVTAIADVPNPVRSLYQTNSAALRATWYIDWLSMRSGAVQTITGAAW